MVISMILMRAGVFSMSMRDDRDVAEALMHSGTRHRHKRNANMPSGNEQTMIDLFQRHVGAEMDGDLETTMATMCEDPHLINVPTSMGGFGRDGVKNFYANHLVGKFFPPDVKMTPVSLTVDQHRVVDELIISFTHTHAIDWMLPGVAPTGKHVEVAFAVIVGVKDEKVSYEHIYWDQASVLVQIGLLDPTGLPVLGAENARKILELAEGA